MKKLFMFLLLFMVVSQAQALTKEEYLTGGDYIGSKNTWYDPFYLHLVDYEALESGELGTGSKFYLDSDISGATAGTSWATAVDTLKEAIALCADNNGDIIYVAQGHEEDVTHDSALVVNKAGITIYGFGEGEDMPEISFITAAGAELTISEADCTIYNIRFLSAYEGGLTAGIVIDGDGDGTRIIGCDFRETSDTYEMLIMISAATGADELVIVGNRFIGVAGGGDTIAIDLAGASNQTVIADNYFYGDWEGYVIENGATSLSMLIQNNVVHNLDDGAGKLMIFSALSTGDVVGNKCYGNGATFAFSGAAMFVSPDNVFMQTEATAAVTRNYESMLGAFTGPVSGAAIDDNVKAATSLIKIDTAAIIEDFTTYGLDELTSDDDRGASLTYPDSIVAESVFNFLMSKTLAVDTYDYKTDSLEMLHDIVGAYAGTSGATDNESAKADIDLLQTDVTSLISAVIAMDDTGWVGTNAGASSTVAVVTLLSGFGEDFFNTGWSMIVLHNVASDGAAPEGEIRDIIDYVSGTGTFTLNYALTAALATGDRVMVKRTEELELDIPTVLGSSGQIWYVSSITGSSGNVGDGTGKTWENAFATVTLAEAKCGEGDTVYIAAGHDEDVTTGTLKIDNAPNVSFIGLGEGDARPLITCTDDGTALNIDEAGITIKNIRLQSGVTACDIGIDVDAVAIGCTLENISFIDGEETTVDEFVICIRVNALASNLTVKNCTYYSLDASDHVASFIDLSGTTIDSPSVIGCTIFGDFSQAPIWGDAAIPVNVLIKDNVISNTTSGQLCIEFTGAATGICQGNMLHSPAYGANGITIIDPGEMKCIENYAVDAINETAILVPFSAETSDITAVEDGSNLERLEYLQELSESALAALNIDTTRSAANVEQVWYVDSVSAVGGSADTWGTSANTIKAAIDLAADSTNAIIFVAPNHADTIAAAVAIDCPGVRIIGLGHGESRPKLTFTAEASCLAHEVADVMWKNIIFISGTLDTTAGITLDTDSEGTIFEDCVWINTTTIEFVSCVTASAACEDVRFTRCRFINDTTDGGAAAAITNIVAVCDNWIIEDCYFFGAWTTAAITSDDAETNWIVRNNIAQQNSTGVPAIKITTAASGVAYGNKSYADTWNTITDFGVMKVYDNLETYAADESGYLNPAAPVHNPAIHGTGRVIYLDSGATAGAGNTWLTAFETLDAALAVCVAGRGDTIYVAPGHVEGEDQAAAIATIAKAGVSIIGVSNRSASGAIAAGVVTGNDSSMPTFILENAAATLSVTKDNVTIKGIRFEADAANVAAAITASATADGLRVENCVFRDGAAAEELVIGISVIAACHNVMIENNYFSTLTAGTCNNAIKLAGASDNSVIRGNICYGTYATGVLLASGAVSLDLIIMDNVFVTTVAGVGVALNAGNTGVLARNMIGTTESWANSLTGTNAMICFENYVTGAVNKSGVIYPVVDSE